VQGPERRQVAHVVEQVWNEKTLWFAVAISLAVHMLVLVLRFVDPQLLQVQSTRTPLEVILVNARSDTKPPRPEALAQVNLDGGGAHESGRRASPLPNSFELRDGDTLDTARDTVQQMEQEQKRLLAQLKGGAPLPADPEPRAGQDTTAAAEQRAQLARLQAEIAQRVSDYQKRPRRHHFMPSTSEYRYARYVEDWRQRIEKIGNEHYPEAARGKVYGSLRITVGIRKDGSVAEAVLEQSSQSDVLDRAALRIVKLAAPYAPLPPEIARETDILEITRTWIFSNQQLTTQAAASEPASR
jgi:protein TonB